MAEYVEREEFIQHIEESDLPDMAKRAVIALVRHMPAADVVEVVHGEWLKDGDFLICLNCESEINIRNSLAVENRKNYCPNCGAKMDGERKETE